MQLSETRGGIAIHISTEEAKDLMVDLGGFTTKTGDLLHHALTAIVLPLHFQHADATGQSE